MAPGYVIFETMIGACAIVWSEGGIIGSQLPEGDEEGARRRLLRRSPDAQLRDPPETIRQARDDIVALLAGKPVDLSDVRLDMGAVPDFNRRVYAVTRTIPAGETLTYGEVTQRIGEGREMARAVGQALGQNPFPVIVPCHRVLGANGSAGGFSADGGVATKMRMLSIERARTGDSPSLFDALPFAAAPRRPR